jgi:amino-acid N-acetyltransferase
MAVAGSASDAIIAVAGLEVHGQYGLLRSVAVAEAHRGKGWGALLVTDRLRAAGDLRLRSVHLLTTTAADYFEQLGFQRIPRQNTPPELQQASEFASICPASAVCLVMPIP